MFDPVRFLDDYGIEKFLEGKNVQDGWVNINCPVCEDPSNHGGFNIVGGYYHCWRCGGSSIPWIIKNLLSVSYTKALEIFGLYDSEIVSQVKRKEREVREFRLPGSELERRHLQYLKKRGFGYEVVEKYGLKGTERFGEYRNRIVIPVYYGGRVVSWQARSIVDAEPRYMSCPNDQAVIPLKDILYNIDSCEDRRGIIMEGVIDVWKFGDGACATFGTSLTPAQIALISEVFDEVFILFDNDDAGQHSAETLSVLLSSVGVDTEIVEIDYEDPGSLSIEEAQEIKEELKV